MQTVPPPVAADPQTLPPPVLDGALTVMKNILAEHPDLGNFGFGVFDSRHKTASQREAELAEEREVICQPRSLVAFIETRKWLRGKTKINKLNKKGSSYGLKHVVEREIGYITNGVFIAAAIAEDFNVKRIADSPDAWLNISSSVWSNRDG
jgi:hypothetical protein